MSMTLANQKLWPLRLRKKFLPFLPHYPFSKVMEATNETVVYKEMQELLSVLQNVFQLWIQLRPLPFLLSLLVASPDPRFLVLA